MNVRPHLTDAYAQTNLLKTSLSLRSMVANLLFLSKNVLFQIDFIKGFKVCILHFQSIIILQVLNKKFTTEAKCVICGAQTKFSKHTTRRKVSNLLA